MIRRAIGRVLLWFIRGAAPPGGLLRIRPATQQSQAEVVALVQPILARSHARVVGRTEHGGDRG